MPASHCSFWLDWFDYSVHVQVTGNRYIPFQRDFDEAIGQVIPLTLTEKEGQCQGMAFTPLDNGVCTILFVSTSFNGMETSRQHVCTLSTSEAVISTASSQGTYVWH